MHGLGLSLRNDPAYLDYQIELNGPQVTRSVRATMVVVIVLNSAFILLDYWAHTDRFSQLLPYRLCWDLVAGGFYWSCGRMDPLVAAKTACLLTGGIMVGLIGVAGGTTSNYWPGMMVILLAIPVMLPLSPSQVAGPLVLLLVGFASLPIFTGEEVAAGTYLVPVFFAMAGGVECIASCAVLERLRFADFKQRLELEEARDHLKELDRQKARFTANIHHELRTPLTLMLAPLDALRSGEFGEMPSAIGGTLKTMHVNGKRLHKLINNLLDLARLESSQFTVRRQPMDLGQLVEDVVVGARPLAERKGIELGMEGFEGLREINGDPDALDKVLINLVGNALKFTDSGGRITIRGKAVEEGVEFRVVDTGLGIPADQLERIFDRFAQVDGSATRKHEGTGIGLSLTHELVALHGGRIWAESEGVGCGSSICVVLPVGEADGQAGDEEVLETDDGRRTSLRSAMEAAEAELHLGDGDPGDGATLEMERTIERWEGVHASGAFQLAAPAHLATAPEILVAEDNPDMRKLLAFLLSREFRVRVARNGREALDSLREQAPTLVLTDVMMPEMSGTELCRAIKGDPETAGIPVVLVTSKAEREMKIEGLELGADDYVTKPFHPRELLARVRSLVRVRQLQEELAEQNASLDRALAELKRAEVQLVQNERLAAVGELAAGIAHEVNNPVNFALNAVRTLQSKVGEVAGLAGQMAQLDWRDRERLAAQVEALREAQEELGFGEVVKDLGELVEIVSEGLARTSRLVADLRDFAAPGQRKYAPVDFQKSIESTAQLLRHRLSESNARVEVRIPENLPEFQGDGPALNQVFLNLLKNAAEALDGTGGSIWVDASVVDGGIEIVFRDDGPGIEPAVRERLFEPFFTTKSAGRGTGLGLSISRQIAEAHGGRLEVESAEGEGSTFTLRLPV